MLMRLACAVTTALLLAAAFPLTLPDLPLPAPWGPLPFETPGWHAAGGYGQLPWLAFVALIPLMEAARLSRHAAEASLWGYLAGVLWLLLHWDWLTAFGWLPVVLMALLYAVPTGLFAAAVHWLSRAGGAGTLCWGIPLSWVALEYLRSFGFWAFPWNLLGYTQVRNLGLIQVADLGGVYAVSFLLALCNAALWLLLTPLARLRLRLGHALLAAALVLFALAYGAWRQGCEFTCRTRPQLEAALIQGGISTFERWNDDWLTLALTTYVSLSDQALAEWAGQPGGGGELAADAERPARELLLVWPESALPRSMDQRRAERVPHQLRSLLEPYAGAALLTGALGRPRDDEHAENGCLLVESDGELSWAYSKVRLVAYGEVVPLRNVARVLDYPWGSYDLSAARDTGPWRWREHQLGLGICFDNVFSFLNRRQVRGGAEALLMLTNNSWYHLASGTRQHCDIDVLRAVEYRRPLARVSTTGWSHVIAPTGAVASETAVDSQAVLRASIPPGGATTVYLVLGDLFAQLCLLAAVLLSGRAILIGRSEGLL